MHLPHPAGGSVFAGFVRTELILMSLKTPVFEPATLLSGTSYKAGSVLGRITAGAVSSAAKSGGNTGNGTFVLDVTSPKRLGVKAGIYTIRVVELHAVHDYTVELQDPDGYALGSYRLTGTGANITIDDDIKGVLTDGATDFIVGDGFDVTVAAGSNKLALAAAAAEDGSAVPFAVLCEDVNATAADKNCPVLVEGYLNEEALVFGVGHTADTVRVALRDRGIHMRTMKYSG
jgi:hypothetical protein